LEDRRVRDPIDKMQPWTIKSMSTEARDMAVIAARREGLTVGQWLERVIREAASDQSAVVANKSAPGPDVVRLAPLVASMPRWLRAALWRRVAGELGVEAPAARTRRLIGASSRENAVTSE
jgi:hypothetical protein